MARPTAQIRKLLLLASEKALVGAGEIGEQVDREIANEREFLRRSGIEIVDRQIRNLDIWVQYRTQSTISEASYMAETLFAEARAALSRRIRAGESDALGLRPV